MTINRKSISAGALAIVFGLGTALALSPHSASASALSTLAGRDLTIGDDGGDVADLQGILSEQGYLQVPLGIPYGHFGPLTRMGLASYQASIGVPATGYYGPLTRAKMTQIFTARGWLALLVRENG